jgi:hypothetical protein
MSEEPRAPQTQPKWSRGFTLAVFIGDSDPEDGSSPPRPSRPPKPFIPSIVTLYTPSGKKNHQEVYPSLENFRSRRYPKVNYTKRNFIDHGVTSDSFIPEPGLNVIPRNRHLLDCCEEHRPRGPPRGSYPTLDFNPWHEVDCLACDERIHVGCLIAHDWQYVHLHRLPGFSPLIPYRLHYSAWYCERFCARISDPKH